MAEEPRYLGVQKSSERRYRAQIWDSRNKKKKHLGTFDTAVDAALAYDNAARELRGPDVVTNFHPNDGDPGEGHEAGQQPQQIIQQPPPLPFDLNDMPPPDGPLA